MGKISSSLLGLAILLFLLPWITVSCGDAEVFTFSGTDFAIGKTIEIPQAFGESKKENTREGRATIAFIVGIAGVLAGFLIKNERIQKVILGVCGGAGGIFLYLLKNKLDSLDSEALAEGWGIIGIDYHFGFWMSLLLFFGVGILNILSLAGVLQKFTGESASSISYKSTPKPSFCSQCGSKVSPDDTFCSECGHSLK
jgi:hypothetical protein